MGQRREASPFVGREAELARLRDLLMGFGDRASVAAALVEGEAGIGKTRLVDEAIAGARRDLLVLRGTADEFESSRPFGAIVDTLGLRADPTGGPHRLTTVAGAIADNLAEHRIIDEILDAVHGLAAVDPVAIVIDDLQWADESSIAAIAALARRSHGIPFALVATMRPTPRSRSLNVLVERLASHDGLLLRVPPLSAAQIHLLASGVLDAAADEDLGAYLGRTGGNPLYLIELVGALTDDKAIAVSSGRSRLTQPGVPPSLRLTLLRRLSMLPPATVDLLRTASLLGGAFSLAELAAIRGEEATAIVADLRAAMSAGFIEERAERIAFRHDLIHEALYGDFPVDVRRALHREAARALAARGHSAVAVAGQFSAGAEHGDAEAITWMLKAADDTGAHSVATAVELWQRALDLGVQSDDRTRTVANLLLGLVFTGRVDEAIDRGRAFVHHESDSQTVAAARYMLAMAHGARGEFAEKYDTLAAIPVADMPGARLASIQTHQAEAAIMAGDGAVAARHARVALELAEQTNVGSAIFEARLALAASTLAGGDVAGAWALAVRARAVHPTFVDAGFGHPVTWLIEGKVLRHLDRSDEAEHVLRSGLAGSRERGVIAHAPMYHAELATLLYTVGRWDDALTEAETGMDLVDETGVRDFVGTCVGVRARISLHRQLNDDADALIETLGRPSSDARIDGELVAWVAAELCADDDGQLRKQLECWDARASVRGLGAWRMLGPDLVRLAVRSGQSAIGKRVADEIDQLVALAPDVPGARVAGLRARLLLGGADSASTGELIGAARSLPSPLERAAAYEDAATIESLHEAVEIWTRLGATRDGARVDAALRKLGVRRGRRGPRGRPATGWDSLTTSEQQVVRHVAGGLSNKEIATLLFISPRTVETHLRHVYAKLGVRSRVELATTARNP